MKSKKNTFKLLFIINRSKSNKDGAPILLRITVDGSMAAMNLRKRIPAKAWSTKAGMPCGNSVEAQDILLYLETVRSRAFQIFTELSREYDEVTPELIRDHLQGVKGGASRSLMEIWEEHNLELKKTIGKECSYTLWQKHNTSKNHFRDFLRIYYRTSDVPIKQVRYHMIREYEQYLKGDKGLSYNTTVKFLQFTKKITIRAIKSGWLKVDPFQEYKLSLKETDRPYLTEMELDSIKEKHFKNIRLDQVKDIFLFSCYTGLAYADVKKLHRAEIERTPNGLWWIKTRRQKTKQRSQLPIFAAAKEIIDKYTDLSALSAKDEVLPVISNQKMNAYLKEIANIVGIEKNLTFHVARHTFATTVTLQNGISIEAVSRMMGHTNIQSTQHYARIVDKKIADEMMAMSERANLPLAQ
jgi:site-specific recombinase XerD